MTADIRPIRSSDHESGHGGGNGHDLHARVSVLEAQIQNLATKEDIQRLETLIAQREASMQRWLIGVLVTVSVGLIAAVASLTIALVRTFS